MALRINRDRLIEVFGNHREAVQIEEALNSIESLSAQAEELSTQIEAAKQELNEILEGSSIAAKLTDTTGFLISSNQDLTDFSGSDTVTLNTAPVSGDPTKWVAINDNGATRYIPAW